MNVLPLSIHKPILSNQPKSRYLCSSVVVKKLDLPDLLQTNTFAWNRLIQTHISNKHPLQALSAYHGMMLVGVAPDNHTLPRVLIASRLCSNLDFGKQVHAHVFKLGFSSDPYVVTALIEMYGRLNGLDSAKWVLDNAPTSNSVHWNALAKLYLMDNKPQLAIEILNQMHGLKADIDAVGLVTAISACSRLKSLQQARHVHQIVRECGYEFDLLVCNSLLNMYIDCDSMEEAQSVFDAMPSKDVISWTQIIRGHVKNGEYNEGLKLLCQMIKAGIGPDSVTISSALPACARLSAHKQGKELHAYLLRNRIDFNLTVQNAIMDMYVKSGFIELAAIIFKHMLKRDIVSWTVMMLGYSLHGQGGRALDLFFEMEHHSSLKIDDFAYAAVLHACVTACRVDVGRRIYFNCIRTPTATHSVLMVAFLARAALFNEARTFIRENRIEKEPEVLRALLDGCRIHQQLNIGKQVVEQLCELEPLNAENYVLLSNWYAECGKWDMVDHVKMTMTDMGLKPKKAHSWIEFRNRVHVFGTGDVSHPRSEMIYWNLQHLVKKMEDEGEHISSSVFSLHDVDEERECISIGHSELLAISFGLISTKGKETIRVTKNMRVCQRCHDYAKVISKTVEREIIIKDPNFFHHFKHGHCSCGNLW